MSERYFITGVQLGMIEAFININKPEEAKKVLNDVFDNQFVGSVKNNAKHSVVLIQEDDKLGLLKQNEA